VVSERTRGLLSAAGLLVGHLGCTALLAWGSRGAVDAVRGPSGPTVDSAVAVAAAVGAWAVLSWLTLVTVLALLTAAVAGIGSAAHRRVARRTPVACRRLVAALLGLTIAGAPLATALPAGAAGAGGPAVGVVATEAVARVATQPGAAGHQPAPSLDRPAATVPAGWTPDRPVTVHRRPELSETAVRLVATTPRPERAVGDEVTVRRGDTLWDIAARHLGPDASAAEIAAEWPRWHRANRAVIGGDPDLLRPGERLVPPSGP
jgi:nucleoid-associated protein YgaU